MTPRTIPCFFAILIIAMSLLAGCADEPAPAPVRTTVVTTVPPTTIPPAPTLSPDCRDLLAAADADRAFMYFLTDNIVYSRTHSLAYRNCILLSAAQINEDIAKGPRPKTPALARARQYLMSATTYCYDPSSSAAQTRTRDDMEKYMEMMSDYTDLVYSCTGSFDRNVSSSLHEALADQGSIRISGKGNHVEHLTVTREGMRIFSMARTGPGNFSVNITDGQGKTAVIQATTAGAFSGRKTERLTDGNYRVDVKADGPWTLGIFNP